MKKYAFILLTIIALSFVMGCHANKSNINISKNDFNDTYILEEELFEDQSNDMSIKITYPQIKNSDNPAAKQINYIIKDNAIDRCYDKYSLKGLTLDQSYEVELYNNEMLSIVFYQYSYVEGTPHPNSSCHAITINLKTAERLFLSDFIKSHEDVENGIVDGNYEILYGGFKAMNKDEIIKIVNEKLKQDNFYISKSRNICILIDLPHSGGGYSVIRIDKCI